MATRITHYDQGDVWTPQATFTVANVATDPTNVTVRIKNPDGVVTVLGPVAGATGGSGITRVSPGVFNTAISLTDAGYWYARFEGTGTATATEEQTAVVDPSEFYESAQLGTRALVSLAETKDWLQGQAIGNIDTTNDLELARVINDVSDRIHSEAEREFKANGTNPQTRYFDVPIGGHSDPWYVDGQWMGDRSTWRRTIPVGDMAAAPTQVQIIDFDWTTVVETVVTTDTTVMYDDSRSRLSQTAPWQPVTRLLFQSDVTTLNAGMKIAVTGSWGFPAIPGNIRQAVLDAVASIMDRDVEHYRQDLGNVSGGNEAGTVVVVGGGGQRLLSLPPSAAAVAWSYRLPNVG